jgi:hypothetical protein
MNCADRFELRKIVSRIESKNFINDYTFLKGAKVTKVLHRLLCHFTILSSFLQGLPVDEQIL